MSDQPASTNPLAIASLVVGIISLPCTCLCYGFPFNILAIVLGAVAVVQANGDPSQGGKGMAYGGIGLGFLSIVLAVLVFFLAIGMNTFAVLMNEL